MERSVKWSCARRSTPQQSVRRNAGALPGPSGLMRAYERSRQRQLLQPRVERAHRGCCALNVGKKGGRVAARLESTSYWCTYQRHCGNAGTPEILVFVPAALCECWAQRLTQERARPLGNQPENWWAERRSFASGNRVVFFLRGWYARAGLTGALHGVGVFGTTPAWLDFDCAVSEVVATFAYYFLLPLLFFSPRFSFLCSLNAALCFGRIFHFGIFGPIIRGHLHGPVFDVDFLDHGPPRGRAAALRIRPRSTLRTRAFSLSLAT